MKKFLFLFLFCNSVAFCQERIGMVVPSDEQQQVEDLLSRLESAVCNEDSRTYLSCFTKDLSSKLKKKIVLKFMKHDMEMEINKFEILDSDDDFVEFIAKYSIYEDSEIRNIVSSVCAKRSKDKDALFISKEEIISDELVRKNRNSDFVANNAAPQFFPQIIQVGQQGDCPDGKCNLPPRKAAPKKFDKDGFEVLEGISMFNDADGNPDPNGIMWLDPMKLIQMYPDRFGLSPCARGQCPPK